MCFQTCAWGCHPDPPGLWLSVGGCAAGAGIGATGLSEAEGGGGMLSLLSPRSAPDFWQSPCLGGWSLEKLSLGRSIRDAGTRTFSAGCAASSLNEANKQCDYFVPLEGVTASNHVPTSARLNSLLVWCSPLWGELAVFQEGLWLRMILP